MIKNGIPSRYQSQKLSTGVESGEARGGGGGEYWNKGLEFSSVLQYLYCWSVRVILFLNLIEIAVFHTCLTILFYITPSQWLILELGSWFQPHWVSFAPHFPVTGELLEEITKAISSQMLHWNYQFNGTGRK